MYATIKQIGSKGIYVVIEPVKLYNIAVNWAPVEGLVIVSDREADFNKNVNVWSDYTAYSGILKVYKGDAYHDVLFKYGSLIATGNDATATTEQEFTAPTAVETTNDVIWYPGNFDVTGIGNWDDVPYIMDASSITSGNTPELVASGKGDPCRLAALSPHQIGVDDYIAKPFSIHLLKGKIANQLKARQRLKHYYSNTIDIDTAKMTSNNLDEEFMSKAIQVVEENISNEDFTSDELASQLCMSRSSLYLKMNSISGEPPANFIRRIRFNKACKLLLEGRYSISEISGMAGFGSSSYFSTSFKKYVGCLPSEYVKQHTK